jgi:hypothetical protein
MAELTLREYEIEHLREALSRAHGYLSRASLVAESGKDCVRGDGPLTYPYAVGAAISAIETAIATLARAEGRSDG